MEPNESSSGQKIILKCKPFTILSDVPSNSSPKASVARRSTRITSRTNENVVEGEASSGKGKQVNRNGDGVHGVQSSSDDDDVHVIARRKKMSNKRRSQNRIKSSDEEDDDFVTNTPKKKTPKKRRSNSTVQSNVDDVVKPKSKTPVKRRKPLLTIKCNKITDYFGKSTKTEENDAEEVPEAVPVIQTNKSVQPSDLIILSSSEEQDDNMEQVQVVNQNASPPPLLPPERPSNPPSSSKQQDLQVQVVKNSVPPLTPPSHRSTTNLQQRKKLKCPDYKIVEGINFAVDAFRFGEIAGVSAYFLTHFHSDHYIGLNRKFSHPIYMSTITGRLVKAILKVNGKLIRPMSINTTYVIDGVEVTPIDANHCPGAVMFIFKLPCGRTILHTGDFRATPEMESNPVFWNNNFSTIYLDTTYLHKSYNFCTQMDALLFVEDEVKKFQQKNVGKKYIIVVGSYMIGKERVWSHIAQTFNMKVWLEGERRRALDLIYSDENKSQVIKDCICDVREGGQVHVIPIRDINYAFLMNYLKNFEYHSLLAFRPTGWAQNSKPQYGSRVSIVGVQYSEHSSYSELERFVRFVQPANVISTVPISSGSSNTRNVPNNWLTAPKPMTTSSQRTLTSFMKVRKSSSATAVDKLSDKTVTMEIDGTLQQQQQQLMIPDEVASCDSMETDFML